MGIPAELIQLYFGLGFTHKEIVLCIVFRHKIQRASFAKAFVDNGITPQERTV